MVPVPPDSAAQNTTMLREFGGRPLRRWVSHALSTQASWATYWLLFVGEYTTQSHDTDACAASLRSLMARNMFVTSAEVGRP